MTKQSSLEDKEAYLKEDTLLARRKATELLNVQKKKHRSKYVKTGWSGLANRRVRFWQKILEQLNNATKASKWHLRGT
jgi:hypothetical protein